MTAVTGSPETAYQAISLFSGAGGLDIGLESAGWQVLAQVEMEHDAAETLELRAKDAEKPPLVLAQRIEDVRPRGLRESLGLEPGALGLLAGGPPCQPFTTSGRRQALSDRRANSLFPAYFHLVDELLPRALLIENVDGILSAALRHRPLTGRVKGATPLAADERKASFLRWFLGELTSRGYSVAWGVVEAADYGVPQMRQRALVIGVRGDEPCLLPPGTYGGPGQPIFRTLREALSDVVSTGPVQPLSPRKVAVYRQVPPGGNWRDLPEDVQRATMGGAFAAEGGKSGWWRRLSWDAPAPTILGMPDHSSTALVHPDESRCLAVNECAAVQSFPTGTRFAGKPRSQYQQIGNAVPPLLGAAVGAHLLRFLRGERLAVPERPAWRKASSNRRIGTHGWATPDGTYSLHAKVRPDHVWADLPLRDLQGSRSSSSSIGGVASPGA